MQIEDGTHSIWVYDFDRVTLTPLVVTEGTSQAPLWVQGGTRIAYRGTRAGFRNLFSKAVDGTGSEARLATKREVQTPTSWCEQAQAMAFTESAQATRSDVWVLKLGGGSEPQPFLSTRANEHGGQFSPDCRWMAYEADETGQMEIFVRAFPGPGPGTLISRGGGTEPVWAPNGGELFYLEGETVMAVNVPAGDTLHPGVPRPLFRGSFKQSTTGPPAYGVSADGKRFLRIQPLQSQGPITELRLVLHFFDELQGRTSPVRSGG